MLGLGLGFVFFTGVMLELVSVLAFLPELVLVLELVLELVFLLLSVLLLDGALEAVFEVSCFTCLSCFCLTAGQSKIEGSVSQLQKRNSVENRRTGKSFLNQNSVPMANFVKIFFWSKSQPP